LALSKSRRQSKLVDWGNLPKDAVAILADQIAGPYHQLLSGLPSAVRNYGPLGGELAGKVSQAANMARQRQPALNLAELGGIFITGRAGLSARRARELQHARQALLTAVHNEGTLVGGGTWLTDALNKLSDFDRKYPEIYEELAKEANKRAGRWPPPLDKLVGID